jgi:hypothetical protein
MWDGDGVTKTFLLQRRQLLPNVEAAGLPATMEDDYPSVVLVYDVPFGTAGAADPTELTVVRKTTANINSGDPSAGEAWIEDEGHKIGNLWVSTMRLEAAAPDLHDILRVRYLPLYQMVIDKESQRRYDAGMIEPRGLSLREFG